MPAAQPPGLRNDRLCGGPEPVTASGRGCLHEVPRKKDDGR
jgi:hypothetical protein